MESLKATVQQSNQPTKIKSIKSKVQQFSAHKAVKIKAKMKFTLDHPKGSIYKMASKENSHLKHS